MSAFLSRSGGSGMGKTLSRNHRSSLNSTVLHHGFQVPLGGRDDPDIDLDGGGAADPFELLRLKHPQQAHLGIARQLPDLVKKDGPFVGPLEAPPLRSMAPVKAPFSWPKSSLSIRASGMAPQFTLIKGRFFGSKGCGSRWR